MTRTARAAILLFFVALAARAALAAATGLSGPPVEDERGYTLLAESVARGDGFSLPVPLGDVAPRTSFRGPVVPVVFAPFASGGISALRIVSIVLGSLGAPLLFLAARRTPLGDRAVWAAAAYALWPPAVYVSVRALSEPVSQTLLLAGLAVAAVPGGRGAAGSGAFAALAVLARPAALAPAALLTFAMGSKRRGAAYAAAFALVLAPWVIRNAEIHGRPLLTTNTGVTLVGGNSDAALRAPHPGKWEPPAAVYAGRADAPPLGMWGWPELTEAESDRRFTADAVAWAKAHPDDAATLAAWKLVRLVDPDQHSAKSDAPWKALLGWLTFAPALVLALGGASRASAADRMLLLGTVATALVFYGDTRMRTCADPVLLVLAAYGVARLRGTREGATVD